MPDINLSSLNNGSYPSGSTANRPSSPSIGTLYFNTDLGALQIYTSNGWFVYQNPAAPTAPTSVVATNYGSGRAYNNGKHTVTFLQTSTGGPAVSFTVTPSPSTSPSTFTTTTNSIDITGLTSGTSYSYTVTATNNTGTSSASTSSTGVVVTTVPDAPSSVSGTPGSNQIALTWSAPNNGGSSITGYIITPYIGASAQTTISVGNITSTTITGLTNGTSYTFTVIATNANGNSSASSASAIIIPTNVQVEYIIVAGGGAGGAAGGGGGGGGGAGGILYRTENYVSGTQYAVTVGGGGAGYGYMSTEGSGQKGTDSTIARSGTTYTAFGGGTGLFRTSTVSLSQGGSGGGRYSTSLANEGISTQTSQGGTAYGNNGGAVDSGTGLCGGGGGSGAIGGNATSTSGGNGGAGTSIFSTWLTACSAPDTTYLAGGGGAGADGTGNTAGTGGAGGGATGGTRNSNQGGSATANTGSGGGGGGGYQNAASGSGGSGVVYIRYPSSLASATVNSGSPTLYNTGGYKYYKFTGNGTITL